MVADMTLVSGKLGLFMFKTKDRITTLQNTFNRDDVTE